LITDLVTKTLAPARTEMTLHVVAIGLKRVTRILDIGEMMRAMAPARPCFDGTMSAVLPFFLPKTVV